MLGNRCRWVAGWWGWKEYWKAHRLHTERGTKEADGYDRARGQHEENCSSSTEVMSWKFRPECHSYISDTADETLCKFDFPVNCFVPTITFSLLHRLYFESVCLLCSWLVCYCRHPQKVMERFLHKVAKSQNWNSVLSGVKFWGYEQCCDLETKVSWLECTRAHFSKVSVLVSRPKGQGLGLGLE